MLVALQSITCPRCTFTVEPGDPVGLIDGELCCEDCTYAHQWATTGL
ncbi:hypothetical protein [Kitasatospora sp. NPDC058478]